MPCLRFGWADLNVGETKDEILHVLEVREEEGSAMSRVELLETEGQVRVSLDAAGVGVVIRFAKQEPLAAFIQIGDRLERVLGSDN